MHISHNQAVTSVEELSNPKLMKRKKFLSWWFIIVAALQLFTIPNAIIAILEVVSLPNAGDFIDITQLIGLILISLFSAIMNTFVSGKSPKFLTNFVGRFVKSTPFKTIIVYNVLYLAFSAYLDWFDFASVATLFGVLAVIVSILNYYWLKFSVKKTK